MRVASTHSVGGSSSVSTTPLHCRLTWFLSSTHLTSARLPPFPSPPVAFCPILPLSRLPSKLICALDQPRRPDNFKQNHEAKPSESRALNSPSRAALVSLSAFSFAISASSPELCKSFIAGVKHIGVSSSLLRRDLLVGLCLLHLEWIACNLDVQMLLWDLLAPSPGVPSPSFLGWFSQIAVSRVTSPTSSSWIYSFILAERTGSILGPIFLGGSRIRRCLSFGFMLGW